MKRLVVVFVILLLGGCATYQGCKQLKQFYSPASECKSGYMVIGITGHAPSCAEQDEIDEIKKVCGWYF